MKKIDIGQTIAILANLGVIAGIVFLAIEINQSNAIARSSTFQQTMSEIADWRATIASSAELTRLLEFYINEADPRELDAQSTRRLQLLMANLFSAQENAYYAKQYGLLGDSEWGRVQEAACRHYRRIERTKIFEMNFITDEYRAYLSSVC